MKRIKTTNGNAFARFGIRYRNINRVNGYRGGIRL